MVQLPAVFIGSSSEGLNVALSVEQLLKDVAETTVWKNGVFKPNSSFLETLMNKLEQFDFAVMVLSPDDLLESRGVETSSPRDNVLFELGLFMGRLGRSRVFVVHQEDADLKLPSDFAGIAMPGYRSRHDDNLDAAVSEACTPIRRAIQSSGFLESRIHQNIENLRGRQDATEDLLKLTVQVMMKGLLTEFEWAKLQGLAAPGPFDVSFHGSMINELYHLDAMRYVQPRQGYGIESIRQRDGSGAKFDLKQYVEITSGGLEYLKLRNEILKDTANVPH